MKFNKDFVFGVATAAYQIEGSHDVDGRTPSIWDTFSKTPGKVVNGDTGDVACDHYNRYKEDIKIMKEIGVDSYRFSISWSRIFPEKNKYNEKGMEFYRNLIKELKKNGIKPLVTLYHWDMPQWAYELGGWLNRESADWIFDYGKKVIDELIDEVDMWGTINEPWCVSMMGYFIGEHAPGYKDMYKALRAEHHVLMGHGKIVKYFNEMYGDRGQIGITLNLSPFYAASDSKEDMLARTYADQFINGLFLAPLFKGKYPEEIIELFTKERGIIIDFIKEGDLELISEKTDFLGINYYQGNPVKYNENSYMKHDYVGTDLKKTAMGWDIIPQGLYDMVCQVRGYTDIPVYIHENGAAFDDSIAEDGKVHDTDRVEFMEEHLKKVAKLNEDGQNVKGFYMWSLLDNFEWAFGYEKRFGIVHVDYKTQKRTMKDSAYRYREIIKNREV